MPTIMAVHEVTDTAHWLGSSRREEFFAPIGVTNIRTFVDPQNAKRVGLTADVADMDAFATAMQSPEAAAAMEHDGVVAETLTILIQA